MTDDEILAAIDERLRQSGEGRNQKASRAAVEAAEAALGFSLPPFYVRLVTEVANGDFGLGLSGLPPAGFWDSDLGGQSIVQAYLEGRQDTTERWRTPDRLLLLCHWGDVI